MQITKWWSRLYTVVSALTDAPASSNIWTMSSWPLRHATCRAVRPSYNISCNGTKYILTNRSLLIVLLPPPNLHCHRGGWLPTNKHHHRGVLQCSRQSFWVLFPDNCPSLPQSNESTKCGIIWSSVNARQVSPVSHTGRPPPRVRFPTRKRQDCRAAGTV